jgi:hypothetical protein
MHRASKVSPSIVLITSTGCRSSEFPACLQIVSLSLAAGKAGTGQCADRRSGSIVPATTAKTNIQGSAAENRPLLRVRSGFVPPYGFIFSDQAEPLE